MSIVKALGNDPIYLNFRSVQQVVVEGDKEDRFMMTMREAAYACRQAQDEKEFKEQFDQFLYSVHQWCEARADKIEAGYVGGLLITNRIGRPLEFQCTTPVRPNRTQELLYGPTLEQFVFAEVIGKTLVDRAAVKPDVLLIDQPSFLTVRELLSTPVIQLPAESKAGTSALDHATVHADRAEDRDWIERLANTIPASADLHEPLGRVNEALNETLRAVA